LSTTTRTTEPTSISLPFTSCTNDEDEDEDDDDDAVSCSAGMAILISNKLVDDGVVAVVVDDGDGDDPDDWK